MTTARRRGVALVLLVACNRAPEQPPPAKGPAVTVVPVVQRRVPLYGQYVGQTESVQTVEIRARVEGYLEQQAVPDGGAVTTGQLPFTSDPRPFPGRPRRAHPARDRLHVYWSVSEREALDVWRRRQAEARPAASSIAITLPDDRVYPQGGRLDFVDRAVDPRTGTLGLRAAFPNREGLLRPGIYVRLRRDPSRWARAWADSGSSRPA